MFGQLKAGLLLVAVTLATTLAASAASAQASYYFLRCHSESYFPKGISGTLTSHSDLRTMKQWCEEAETEFLPVTMYRTDKGNVFEAIGYGVIGELPPIEERTKVTKSPWSKLNAGRLDFGVDAGPEDQVSVLVDVSDQSMQVQVSGQDAFQWPVSTAREGKITPLGSYGVQWLSKDHKSSLYNMTPMPFAVFFDGDYAIHGTEAMHQLGTEASAGCVRLFPSDAALLFKMVETVGQENVRIEIVE